MNHLINSDYIKRWQKLSLEELYHLRNTINDKLNVVRNQEAVFKSLTEILEMLEAYIKVRLSVE